MKILAALILLSVCSISWDASNSMHRMPFPKGARYKVIQAWNGPWGHQEHAAYAYDFIMPIGSIITASRAGTVISLTEHFEDNTRKPGQENFVVLDHGDGTYSRYYHLTKNGVVRELNDKVIAGDTIAMSGNTGASAGPHLHFDVTRSCHTWGCNTIEFRFSNSNENPLQPKTEYTAN